MSILSLVACHELIRTTPNIALSVRPTPIASFGTQPGSKVSDCSYTATYLLTDEV